MKFWIVFGIYVVDSKEFDVDAPLVLRRRSLIFGSFRRAENLSGSPLETV